MRGQAQIKAAMLEARNPPLSAIRSLPRCCTAKVLEPELLYSSDLYYLAVLEGDAEHAKIELALLIRLIAHAEGCEVDQIGTLAQSAAISNGHKGSWRDVPLCVLFEKLEEEIREYVLEFVRGIPLRRRAEAGDVVWTAIMIADHGMMLALEELGST